MRDWRSVKRIYGRRWERRDPLDIPETGLSTQLLIVQRETVFSKPFAHSHARFALLTDLSWRTLAKGLSF